MKKILLLFALSFFVEKINAQTLQPNQKWQFKYQYDLSGNRTNRIFDICTGCRKMNAADTSDVELQKPVDKKAETVKLGGYQVTIYPNPTLGHMKIEVSNFPANQEAYYYIFDISGATIISKTAYNYVADIDLTPFPAGVYVLRNAIGNDIQDWKIIKQ